ncbi:hypothetical protein FRIGORI9N_70075 [Frigoribacterium sp. 9N]|nr:hypothetical protein FRIGORI9N_70075 [Frigoribacterium sp. 9N]
MQSAGRHQEVGAEQRVAIRHGRILYGRPRSCRPSAHRDRERVAIPWAAARHHLVGTALDNLREDAELAIRVPRRPKLRALSLTEVPRRLRVEILEHHTLNLGQRVRTDLFLSKDVIRCSEGAAR